MALLILRRNAISHRRRKSPRRALAEPETPGPEETESLVRGIIIEQMGKLAREIGRYWQASTCWVYHTRNSG